MEARRRIHCLGERGRAELDPYAFFHLSAEPTQLAREGDRAVDMPDPISRYTSPSADPTIDPYSDDVGKMSRADAPNSSLPQPAVTSSPTETPAPSSPAVPKLVSSISPPPSVLPPAASTAHNNAERTSERLGADLYADAGTTKAGGAVYAGVALVKGHDPKSGANLEILSASAQIGAQSELQVGLQRISASRGALTGGVETFTARANAGIYNDDGSTGLNVGFGATAIGFEGTVGSTNSLTYGVAASAGAAGSVGVRDIDHDGKTELCGRVSWGPVTLGACVENPL